MKEIIYNQLHKGLRKNGSRKADRTDEMHEGLVSEIKKLIPNLHDDYIVEFEEPVPCTYGNSFKVDVRIKNRHTGKLHSVILVKAIISSVQKNRANYANTSVGEYHRVVGKNPETKVFFITIIPNVIPNYVGGKLRNLENKATSFVDLNEIDIHLKNAHYGTITYDVEGVDYTTKETFFNTLKSDNVKNVKSDLFEKSVEVVFG
tara:strand:+ start:132 stop:743 length:612 start_codon:yes stop_codon:yes gene_type:complete